MSQINDSSNSFTKDAPAASSNSFTSAAPAASTNEFTKEALPSGNLAWEGDDLTDAAAPGDMISGLAPGVGELGGVAHFKARTRPTISH